MGDSFDPETIIEIDPRFQFDWEDGHEVYVLRYDEGLVTLNESASEILKRCDGSRTVAAITQDLEAEYGDPERRPNIHEFLRVAHEHGWIRAKQA